MEPELKLLIFLLSEKKSDDNIFDCTSCRIDKKKFLKISEGLPMNILLKCLKNKGISKKMPYLMNALKQQCFENIYFSSLQEKELLKLAAQFKHEKISFLLIKGFSISKDKIYSQINDIDILINKKDLQKCDKLLNSEGYTTKDYVKYWLNHDCHIKYIPKDGIKCLPTLEIHWSLDSKSSPFEIALKQAMKSSEKLKIGNAEISVLSKPAHLVHLSIQTFYRAHGKAVLKNLYFIHLLSKQADWKEVVQISENWHASSFVYYALMQSKQIFGTEIPTVIINELRKHSKNYQLSILNAYSKFNKSLLLFYYTKHEALLAFRHFPDFFYELLLTESEKRMDVSKKYCALTIQAYHKKFKHYNCS